MPTQKPTPRSAEVELAKLFLRSGYKRVQDTKRLKKEGWTMYKKGSEVRLVAQSAGELRHIRSLLKRAGFRVANAYANGLKFVQPIYGAEAVKRFDDVIERLKSKKGSAIKAKAG